MICYVLETKNYALRIKPNKEEIEDKQWRMVMYSNSDWALDCQGRKNISGYILYIYGMPICWRSRGQKSVALLLSEAEYVALSEAAKEVKFIYQLVMVWESRSSYQS